MERNFRIAVKAFIVHNNQLLVIKRRPHDVHKPGEWDIPGGRLEIGEDPRTGVQREAMEEVGLPVEPIMPVDIHHFTRDDGQLITMIIFICKPESTAIMLSEEHVESQWLPIDGPISQFPEWLQPTIKQYNQHIKVS